MASSVSSASTGGHKGRGLSGLSVIECGEGVSAAFASKMLADLGAEVVKVEPLRGDITRQRGPFRGRKRDPEESGLFLYLNANKRGIALDLTRPEGQELLGKLLERAHILFHNIHPNDRRRVGLESAALVKAFPNLIVVGISPFGDEGVYSSYRAYELNVVNAGGWAYLSPGASPYPELPPLKCFGQQGHYQGGLHAAIAALAAYRARAALGRGQAIEVSEQECIAAMLEMNFMHFTYAGRQTSRLGSRSIGPWFMLDCADGKIFVVCVEEDQWQRLVEFMGNPEWAKEELFKDRVARGQNCDALKALMQEWARDKKVAELFHQAQARRIPMTPVNTMADLYQNEHLKERNFLAPIAKTHNGELIGPGAPTKYGAISWSIRRQAPRFGQHNEEVLVRELGVPKARYEELRKDGIIAGGN